MHYVRGDKLPLRLRAQILNAYPYRWTIENLKRARQFYGNLQTPKIEPITDNQWLFEHSFAVTKKDELAKNSKYAHPAFMALTID